MLVLWTFSSGSTFFEIFGVLMKEYLFISRLIMKPGMFRLWHLDNLVLAMQLLQLTIENLCHIQFESQMSMILCLICLHIILISLKRRTTTSQERYAFANWSDDYMLPYYLFIVRHLLPNLFLHSRCGFTTLDWEVLFITLRRSVMVPGKTQPVAGKHLLWC